MNKNSVSLRPLVMAGITAAVLLAGCSSIQVGREFNYEQFSSKVRVGTTTLSEVNAVLGPPMGKGLVAEADGALYDQWTYYFGNGDLGNSSKSRFKLLQIRFDQGGKVASYNWSGDMSGAPPVSGK